MVLPALLLGLSVHAAMTPPDYRAELGERLAAEVASLAERGRYDEAVDRAERIVREVEPLAPVLYELALAHNRSGNDGKALAAYDRCLEVDPTHAAALYDRGEISLARGDLDRARADFTEAARLMPDHWAVHFRLAHIAGREHDAAAFEDHLTDALRNGFDFRTIVEDPEWKAWSRDDDLGPVLARLITVYSDERILEQLRSE